MVLFFQAPSPNLRKWRFCSDDIPFQKGEFQARFPAVSFWGVVDDRFWVKQTSSKCMVHFEGSPLLHCA